MDFLLVLIQLFSLGVKGAEALRANIGQKSSISLQRGPVDPKFQVRLNDLSYGIKIWIDFSPVLSQFTRLKDRQTNGHLSRH